MGKQSITLTGWKAVAVIAVVVGFGGFRLVSARASLDTDGREVLEEWIAVELQRGLLAASGLATAEEARAVLDAGEVRIRSLSAKGPPEDMIVRVELEPLPGYPEGTETTRYYRMEHSTLTGWRTPRDATPLAYYLAVF